MPKNGLTKKVAPSSVVSMENVVFMHRVGPTMASYRLRAEIPARAIGACINEGLADILVLSKPLQGDVDIAKQVVQDGGKVVLDICDPHDYSQAAAWAHAITCPTETMRSLIGKTYKHISEVHVIPDPYEIKPKTPHVEDATKMLWFGHNRNLRDIQSYSGKFEICTGPKSTPPMVPWSEENLAEVLSTSNVVLLPTSPGAEYKSANRLIMAVMAGCFVVAHNHPAYEEFKDFIWVGQFKTGIQWAQSRPSGELNRRVNAAQNYVMANYSPEIIGEKWRALLSSI